MGSLRDIEKAREMTSPPVSPEKRTPTEVERKFIFHSNELIEILGLTGKRVSKVGYSAVGDWWEIMTTDDA
jgi:hypothetical protein